MMNTPQQDNTRFTLGSECLELLDNIKIVVFVLEPFEDGRLEYIALNTAGRDKANVDMGDVLHKTAEEIYLGPLGEIAYEYHLKAYRSGKAMTYQITLPAVDKMRIVKTHLQPIFDSNGKVVRLIGTSQEVAEQQKMEASSIALESEIEEFVSMAAHDLRSPVRNIQGLALLLREGLEDNDDGKLEIIDMLENVANKAQLLIADILSHAEATGATTSLESFELSRLCRDIASMLDPSECHSIVVPECWLTGDLTATQIVLRNLFDNAYKYNEERSIVLSVSATVISAEYFQITVSDNGVGIDNPDEVFSVKPKAGMVGGFGLLGVRRLVLARGGEINAVSPASGAGAMFQFTLPGQIQ